MTKSMKKTDLLVDVFGPVVASQAYIKHFSYLYVLMHWEEFQFVQLLYHILSMLACV